MIPSQTNVTLRRGNRQYKAATELNRQHKAASMTKSPSSADNTSLSSSKQKVFASIVSGRHSTSESSADSSSGDDAPIVARRVTRSTSSSTSSKRKRFSDSTSSDDSSSSDSDDDEPIVSAANKRRYAKTKQRAKTKQPSISSSSSDSDDKPSTQVPASHNYTKFQLASMPFSDLQRQVHNKTRARKKGCVDISATFVVRPFPSMAFEVHLLPHISSATGHGACDTSSSRFPQPETSKKHEKQHIFIFSDCEIFPLLNLNTDLNELFGTRALDSNQKEIRIPAGVKRSLLESWRGRHPLPEDLAVDLFILDSEYRAERLLNKALRCIKNSQRFDETVSKEVVQIIWYLLFVAQMFFAVPKKSVAASLSKMQVGMKVMIYDINKDERLPEDASDLLMAHLAVSQPHDSQQHTQRLSSAQVRANKMVQHTQRLNLILNRAKAAQVKANKNV